MKISISFNVPNFTHDDMKQQVNYVYHTAAKILGEQYNANKIISGFYKYFSFKYMKCLKVVETISPNPISTRTSKIRYSASDIDSSITLTNKYIVLQNEVMLDNAYSDIKNENASPQNQNTVSNITTGKKGHSPLFSFSLVR